MSGSSSSGAGKGRRGKIDDDPKMQQLEVYNPEEVARLEEQIAREEAELAMTKAVLGSIFSVRKPRDVVAGTSSGLKTVAKGVGLGLASLVAQPYIGAKTGGARGFIKGVGAGTLTCVASAVTGTVVGTGQIVRGVVNTPNAIVQKARGQVWNTEERKWETDWYSLPEEEMEVFGAPAESMAGGSDAASSSAARNTAGERRPTRHVVDRSLYNLLEVPPEATDAEIRRAFYKKSLALHPDKNPDNPEATAKFQAISDAYRVLGDTDRRRVYDEHGQDTAAAGLPKIEPVVFFAALFGSHHFEPYIGRLKLAQEIDGDLQALLRDAVAGSEEEPPAIDVLKVHRAHLQLKLVERQRQVRCAVALAKRLDPVVGLEGEEYRKAFTTWEAQHTTEIAKLAQAPCGVEMLYLIGWVYANRARQFFAGGMLRRVMAKVEGEVHIAHSKAKLAGSVGRTCITVNGIMKTAEKKKKSLAAASAAKRGEEDGAQHPTSDEYHAMDSSASEGEGAPSKRAAATGTAAEAGAAKATSAAPGSTSSPPQSQTQARTGQGAEGGRGCGTSSGSTPPGGSGGGPANVMSAAATSGGACNGPPEDAAQGGASNDGAPGDLPPGCLVMLRGLRATPELNDEVGMVCGFEEESSRYLVQILPDVGLKKLKRENLLVLEAPEFNSGEPQRTGGATGSSGGASSSSAAPPPSSDAGGEDQWAKGGDDADMADAFKDCMPLFHDAFWSATALDVEFTLGKVIQKVLRDMSVDKKVRRQRADALLRLGTMLQEPMKEQRRKASQVGGPGGAASTSPSAGLLAGAAPTGPAAATGAGANDKAKKSVLARFRPRAPWRPSPDRRTQKARELELKQKRMEAALAMMAAGASTEDVDEMAAARAAMEAEVDGHGGF
uniref:J domain-containing protein n=2 Tax=Pyrodinium bahamense TaxID=73915 RepID=A0A7S0FAW9_9DINO|mmetsp:Transcript_17196/g.47410  ORF Transcript_17196/g.47410 Transcript_17196/m.47410 type:complete len:892 (+) Transcript_17196:41-2716(+)